MKRLSDRKIRLVRDVQGATMVEHGLMVALIAVVCLAAVTLVGSSLRTMFGAVSHHVTSAGVVRPPTAPLKATASGPS